MPRKRVLLSDRIDELYIDLGNILRLDTFKAEFSTLSGMARAMESSEGNKHLAEQITALETQIENVKAMHKSQVEELKAMNDKQAAELKFENDELQSLLEKSNMEVNRLREEQSAGERQDSEEKPPDLPPDALNILMQICEAPYGVRTIAETLDLHRVLVQHHLNVMHGYGLVTCAQGYDAEGNKAGMLWMSTKKGVGQLVDLDCFGKPEPKKEYLSGAERRIIRYIDQSGLTTDAGIAHLLDCGEAPALLMLDELESAGWLGSRLGGGKGKLLYFLTDKAKAWAENNPADLF